MNQLDLQKKDVQVLNALEKLWNEAAERFQAG